MKLATLSDGSRDGQLVVVSRDLTLAHYATGMAGTLRQLLDDWNFISPQLEDLSATLNGGKARHAFPFDPARCLPPLPRPVAWWAALGEAPAQAQAGPARGGPERRLSDNATRSALSLRPALAAITGDLAADADAATALESLRLLVLAGEWCAADGHAEPVFGPVAATPDELGTAWARGRLGGQFRQASPGRGSEHFDAATAQASGWGELIAGLARGRPLAAGSLVVAPLVPPAPEPAGRRAVAWHFAWVGEGGDEALGAITGTLAPPAEAVPAKADKPQDEATAVPAAEADAEGAEPHASGVGACADADVGAHEGASAREPGADGAASVG